MRSSRARADGEDKDTSDMAKQHNFRKTAALLAAATAIGAPAHAGDSTDYIYSRDSSGEETAIADDQLDHALGRAERAAVARQADEAMDYREDGSVNVVPQAQEADQVRIANSADEARNTVSVAENARNAPGVELNTGRCYIGQCYTYTETDRMTMSDPCEDLDSGGGDSGSGCSLDPVEVETEWNTVTLRGETDQQLNEQQGPYIPNSG